MTASREEAPNLVLRIYPDPILRRACPPMAPDRVKARLDEVAEEMLRRMYAAEGVGLAAPQVGLSERFFVMDTSPEKDTPVCMVNPRILEKHGRDTGEEGCLSIPGVRARVERFARVRVAYLDRAGSSQEIEAEELTARVIQHELDHLDGRLFIDRLSTAKRLAVRKALKELEQAWTPTGPA